MIDQRFDRRRLIAGAGATGLALGLGACTPRTPLATTTTPPLCLPPVKASMDRVIRTVAGLRPYREQGFVVREQRIGGTRVIHNYGHGGGGITLSWGSSRLAVDLALSGGHSGPVAVMGAGALGLTTARLLQEAGLAVRIYAENLPPHTTSNVAGGQVNPTSVFNRSAVDDAFLRQFDAAVDYSFRRFQISVGEDTGVRWATTYDPVRERPLSPLEKRIMPGARILRQGEHPFPVPIVREWRTMYVETGRWLAHLLRDLRIGGATVERRTLHTPAEGRPCPKASCSTAPGSARAICSATPAWCPCAASWRSFCRSRKSATPIPAAWATCFRVPTGSCSAAPTSAASGTRRRKRTISPGSSPRTPASTQGSPASPDGFLPLCLAGWVTAPQMPQP